MISATRLRAESRFAEIERRQQKALSEQEEEALAIAENTARLKALRLEREANDRVKDLMKKSTAAAAKKKKPARATAAARTAS